MECKICGKQSDEAELFKGIFEEKLEFICESCAKVEGIPLVKKPVIEKENQENLTVRERMEKLSNPKKSVPRDHYLAHKHLSKLKFPEKRQDHPELIENYDWEMKTARRRKKLSQTQLAGELLVPLQVVVDLESGKIPKDFQDYIEKIQDFLNIKLRKDSFYQKHPEQEKHFFQEEWETKERLKTGEIKSEEKIDVKEAVEKKDQEIDFSNRDKLKNWTLRDLINLKRKKERDDLQKAEKSELVGDDIEIKDN